MKKLDFAKYKQDYRHYICSAITLISLAFGILFPNSIPRIAEALRDVLTSLAYYAVEISAPLQNPVPPTITMPQEWKFSDTLWIPVNFLPETWDEFQRFWEAYCELLFDERNFRQYWENVGDFLFYGSRYLLVLMPLALIIFLKLNGYKDKHVTKRGLKSLQLIRFEQFLFKKIYPVIRWCKDFVIFCRDNPEYYKSWAALWCLHFNVFSIIIALIAYYFYFAASLDVLSIYTQILKLQTDLTPVIRFIPGFAWLVIFLIIYNRVCRSMAFNRLYAAENANRAFLRERGVVTIVYGVMGAGKTSLITSMALSAEVEQFDMARDIMIEQELKFPNFPWQQFRDELSRQIYHRNVVDLRSCRKWVRSHREPYDKIVSNFSYLEWRRRAVKRKKFFDYTYGYDYDHYSSTYNDELKITHLVDVLEDYACAYMIFTVKTTLLFSNYSIRLDSIIQDIGNLPLRDNDFFHRSPEYQEACSRFAHIIDMNMLRLGRKILEDGEIAKQMSYGVYVITEIDKERKNSLELKEQKIKDGEVNQKNDLFNACLKMCRHANVVANRVFIRIICDLQRPEDWGAGGREVGEVLFISDKDELAPALPFMSPYWLLQGIFSWINGKWTSYKEEYDYNRSDGTLFVYLVHNLMAKISNHYDKIAGLFGMQTLTLELQSGTLEGETKKDKWRLLTKKDRSARYKTDCLESVFDSYEPNVMHVDDFISYAGKVGTPEENALQKSHFQNDIAKMRAINAASEEEKPG